ncbi:MAG: hypothetical protein U1E74_06715 [Paenacidovorax caeni]
MPAICAVRRLATQATAGVARIVEGVHQSVLGTMGLPGAAEAGRTRGLTGMVYHQYRRRDTPGRCRAAGQRCCGSNPSWSARRVARMPRRLPSARPCCRPSMA